MAQHTGFIIPRDYTSMPKWLNTQTEYIIRIVYQEITFMPKWLYAKYAMILMAPHTVAIIYTIILINKRSLLWPNGSI